MKNLLTALFFVITIIAYSQTPITDYNFSEAIKTCLTMSPGDGMCSSSEYGAMPDWDVSNVTNMKNAFNAMSIEKSKKNIQAENNVIKILTTIKENKNINMLELLDNLVSQNDIKLRGFWRALLMDLNKDFYLEVTGNYLENTYDNSKVSVNILQKGIDYLLDPCSFYVANQSMFKSVHNFSKTLKYKKHFNADISKWDVSNVTDMSNMFYGSSSFKQDLSSWNVSKVSNMSYMFHMFENSDLIQMYIDNGTLRKHLLEIGDIGRWDVSNVTNMKGMFSGSLFDKDISNWDVSKVTDMSFMFAQSIFNQNISNWNVSNVETTIGMFGDNKFFNQNIGNWNVSRVEDMSNMFYQAWSFNQNLNSWNVSNVKKMSLMFSNTMKIGNKTPTPGFNQDLGNWDVSNVTDMRGMFSRSSFNQDIGNWDVGNVKNMNSMFSYALAFNQDISGWNVSNVKYMNSMFSYAIAFNQNIGSWDVSNVIDMTHLFYFKITEFNTHRFKILNSEGLVFNQDISNWDVSNVINMTNMFYGASSFNKDLGRWNVNNVKTAYNFVDDKNTQWTQNKPKFNNLIKFYKVMRSSSCNGDNDLNCYVYLPESFICSGKDYEDAITRSSVTNFKNSYSIGNAVNFKRVKNNLCFGIVQTGIIKDINYKNYEVDFNTLKQYNTDSRISQYVLTNDKASDTSNDPQKCYSSNKIKDFK